MLIRVFARNPEKVPTIQMAFQKCLASLTRSAIQSLSSDTSPSRSFTANQSADLLAQLSLDEHSRTSMSPSRGVIVQEYQPHPLTTMPKDHEWQEIVNRRGWSPRKPVGVSRKMEKKEGQPRPLFGEAHNRGRAIVFDDLE